MKWNLVTFSKKKNFSELIYIVQRTFTESKQIVQLSTSNIPTFTESTALSSQYWSTFSSLFSLYPSVSVCICPHQGWAAA